MIRGAKKARRPRRDEVSRAGDPSLGSFSLGAKSATGVWSNGSCTNLTVFPQPNQDMFGGFSYRFGIQARVFNQPGGGSYTTRAVKLRVTQVPPPPGAGGSGGAPPASGGTGN